MLTRHCVPAIACIVPETLENMAWILVVRWLLSKIVGKLVLLASVLLTYTLLAYVWLTELVLLVETLSLRFLWGDLLSRWLLLLYRRRLLLLLLLLLRRTILILTS